MPKINGMKKKVKKMEDNVELAGMFNAMLGVNEPDPEIAKVHCAELKKLLLRLILAIDKFAHSAEIAHHFPKEENNFVKLRRFLTQLQEIKEQIDIGVDIPKTYMNAKQSNIMRSIFVIHMQLKKYKEHIENINTLSDKFIEQEVGYEVYPFEKICKMNLYFMWTANPPAKVKKFILIFLHQIYRTTRELCELLTKPDIDIARFSELLVKCISFAKKEIPNCDDAFERIEKAVTLLQDNFGGYYRDFLKTENPSVIFTTFIEDVSKKQKKNNLRIIFQFKTIIKYFQNKSAGQKKDAKLQGIFEMLNKNISTLEQNA